MEVVNLAKQPVGARVRYDFSRWYVETVRQSGGTYRLDAWDNEQEARAALDSLLRASRLKRLPDWIAPPCEYFEVDGDGNDG